MSLARVRAIEGPDVEGGVGRRTWRRSVLVAVVLGALVVACGWGFRQVGAWLVVEDPLAPAGAAVALGGEVPFRAMEAAALYRQGWAAEVWLTRPPPGRGQAALDQLGIQVPGDEVYNRAVLERLGVPAGAIRVLGQPAENTAEEVQVIARELRSRGGPVILVTSKPHSRRVRATWRALVGERPPAIVRYATGDPYDAERWWRHTGDALAVSREVLGLLNVWAGFPVQPARAGL